MKKTYALVALALFSLACNAPDAVAPMGGLSPNAESALAPRPWAQEIVVDHIGPRFTHAGPGPHPTTESDRFTLMSGGIRWFTGGTVEYQITGTQPVSGANAAVVAGEDVWDVLIAARSFARNDNSTQTNPCTGQPNTVSWTSIDGPGGIAGATFTCYFLGTREIAGFDMQLDQDEPWGTNGSTTLLDVGNTAAHEFGHAVGLGHVGSPRDGCLSLYKFVIEGEIQKRTPGWGDKLGLAALYANANTTAGSCGS